MRARARVYDLSFVFPNRKKRTKAKIVFSIKSAHYPLLLSRLALMQERGVMDASEYLGSGKPFHFAEDNLLSHFGYGQCGSVEERDGETHLSMEIQDGFHLHYIASTIHVLTNALSSPLIEGEESNQVQQLDLFTVCKMGEVYGHAFGGHVSSSLTRFLLLVAKNTPGEGDVPMPQRVIDAMREAWRACSSYETKFPSDFRGTITRDGRFMIACPGNACDVAIYPDMVYGDIDEYGAGLSCHNLDTAVQQISLLSGLAALCELAREHTV